MLNQNTIRCLIVDDEPLARDVIRRYIDNLPSLRIVGECSNAIEAMSFLQQYPVDLLFLDIHMPRLKGIELIKILPNSPKVILTTAHAEYALEGYPVQSFLQFYPVVNIPGVDQDTPDAFVVETVGALGFEP